MIAVAERLGPACAATAVDTDWADLRAAAFGDELAFAAIVSRHQGRLLRLCERFLGDKQEAEDATQEVFLKAYRKASSSKPKGQLYTWLYRIAVNHCLNLLRRRRIVRFLSLQGGPEETAFDVADPAPSAERQLEAQRRWQRTRSWLDDLPPAQQAVVILARFEGLSYKEIAAHLGVTIGAVESRLFRAMRALEKRREEEAETEPKRGPKR